jgi:plastocyanin
MKKSPVILLALMGAGLGAAVSVARPASTDGALTASVGPGYAISLTQNGTKVTHLDPGTYTISVDDKADVHNFHLFGPGVDQSTSVDGVGSTTWTVTFGNGTYTYDCDAHPATLIGTFTVGTVPTTTSSTPPAALRVRATAKAAGRLVAVTATATRAASFDVSLLKGKTRVAHRTAKGASVTVRLRAPAAGRYVARVVARAGGSSATATSAVSVR